MDCMSPILWISFCSWMIKAGIQTIPYTITCSKPSQPFSLPTPISFIENDKTEYHRLHGVPSYHSYIADLTKEVYIPAL